MEEKLNSVHMWTCGDVGVWLREIGFDKYVELFTEIHQIDGKVLLSLTEVDLRQPPLQLEVLGDIKRLAAHIQDIRSCSVYSLPKLSVGGSASVDVDVDIRKRERRVVNNSSLPQHGSPPRQDSIDSEDVGSVFLRKAHYVKSVDACDIPLELWKTVLSFIYVFAVFMLTAFVMVVVHDRVPEMDKYPPLPDIFLDNMPYVPWAFEACEIVGVVLGLMWFMLLFFHRHRLVREGGYDISYHFNVFLLYHIFSFAAGLESQ